MANNDGGAAFPTLPISGGEAYEGKYRGMSLRDYFAAKAMQGLMGRLEYELSSFATAIPEEAYAIADAMLAARRHDSTGGGK